MILDTHPPLIILSINAVFTIAILGAIWRASKLKAEVSEKWGKRVSLTTANLDTAATDALLNLYNDISRIFEPESSFKPITVIEDPASLRGRVNDYERRMTARQKIGTRFQSLVGLGPILVLLLIGCLVFDALLVTYLFLDIPQKTSQLWACYLSSTFLPAVAIASIRFMMLENWLANTELLANESTN